eukprot:g5216.t1
MFSHLGVEEYALSCGITIEQLYDHLVLASLTFNGKIVKVHSNILVADQNLAIRSSANLSDRCFSKRPTDSELGVVIKGDTVKTFCKQQYLRLAPSLRTGALSVRSLNKVARRREELGASTRGSHKNACLIRPLPSPMLEESFLTRELTRVVLHAMTGLCEGGIGGMETVNWHVERF